MSSVPQPVVGQERSQLVGDGSFAEIAMRQQQPLHGQVARIRDPPPQADVLRGPHGVHHVGEDAGKRLHTFDGRRAHRHPR